MTPAVTHEHAHDGSSGTARPVAPETDRFVRMLLGLTILSGLLYLATVVSNIVTSQLTHQAFAGAPFDTPPTGAFWLGAVVGLILVIALYVAVLVPLHKRYREGWYTGAILATIGLVHAALSAVVAPGNLLLGLPGIALIVVNAIWLVVAFKPGLRESLG